MSRVGAEKCDCGNYIEDDEYRCVECELWDEVETAWWREEHEEWLLQGYEPSEFIHIKRAEEDE